MKNKNNFFSTKAWLFHAALVLAGFSLTACLSFPQFPLPQPPPPQPTSIAITGIPASHNERQITLRMLGADTEVAFARPGHIIDGAIRLDMLDAETEAQFFASGNYVIDIVISILVLGREIPVPVFIGQTAFMNITEGANNISWDDIMPTPVTITITEIPPVHNGRMAALRLVSAGVGDGAGIDLATAPPAQIAGSSVTIGLVDPETQEQFFARGAYAFVLVISEQLPTVLGITPPPIPRWGGLSAALNIVGGPQIISFASFVGGGF